MKIFKTHISCVSYNANLKKIFVEGNIIKIKKKYEEKIKSSFCSLLIL